MKVLLLVLIGVMALSSCSAGVVVFKFYVVVKPDETTKFFGVVAAISKESGLETATGQIVDSGIAFSMMEGRGHGVKLWVQNSMLTGREDPSVCGVPVQNEPYADPAQFQVSTEPIFFGSKAGAAELGERVLSGLHKSGFDVRRQAVICGAGALHGRL